MANFDAADAIGDETVFAVIGALKDNTHGASDMVPAASFNPQNTTGHADYDAYDIGTTFLLPPGTYYKMAATCSSSPSGYVTWVNTTGDDLGQPTCGGTLGPSFIVSTWRV